MRTAVSDRPRRAVAAYDDYVEAQRAVERLADQGVPLDKVAIVGHGVQYAERVVERMTRARAALLGAIIGGLIGAFFGVLMSLVFSYDPNPAVPLLVLYGLLWGALLGGVLGALLGGPVAGPRGRSIPVLSAERYEIVVDDDIADRAAELVGSAGA
jgi:hypothetical protein